MASEHAKLLALLNVPNTSRLVVRRSERPLAVRRKRDIGYATFMAHEAAEELAGGSVPESCRFVIAGGERPRSIRRKNAGVDKSRVNTAQLDECGAAGRVPDASRVVPASSEDFVAAARELHRRYGRLRRESHQRFAVLRLPQMGLSAADSDQS